MPKNAKTTKTEAAKTEAAPKTTKAAPKPKKAATPKPVDDGRGIPAKAETTPLNAAELEAVSTKAKDEIIAGMEDLAAVAAEAPKPEPMVYLVKIRYAGRVVATETFAYLTDAQRWADEQRQKFGVGATEEITTAPEAEQAAVVSEAAQAAAEKPVEEMTRQERTTATRKKAKKADALKELDKELDQIEAGITALEARTAKPAELVPVSVTEPVAVTADVVAPVEVAKKPAPKPRAKKATETPAPAPAPATTEAPAAPTNGVEVTSVTVEPAKLTEKGKEVVAAVAKPLGKSALATLTALSQKGRLTRAGIAESIGVTSGFTSLLGHLEPAKREPQSLSARGLIEPETVEVEGKSVTYWTLTEAGKKALAEAQAAAKK